MATKSLNDDCSINMDKNDQVVISGISGIFPKSDSVYEFMENLYKKVDMVSGEDESCPSKDLEVPKYSGKISSIDKFDAQFFKIGFQLALVLDPMSRKLLEHTYAAIFDSGTNLLELKGKKIGVFIGASYTDASLVDMYEIKNRSNFKINGGSKAMFANRISYWIDGKGPSYTVDYADASSIVCLEQAYNAMRAGDCDAAIVGGCNFCMIPNVFVNIKKAGLLCDDGKTKCFDKNADGYVRSDAIGVIFLQKEKDAKRIYAEISHVKGIYGFKDDVKFLPMHQAKDIEKFLNEFYTEANVNPKEVEYIEAQGTALPEADKNEIMAINKIFGDSRPTKIGCVKSNMGCSEAASGICALTKLCGLYHTGQIPANLHYHEPQNIDMVEEGKIQIVTENTDFNRGYSALNNFSFTGGNFHALLKGRYKPKDHKKYKSEIPYLVLASGRQENNLNVIFNHLRSKPIDPEEIGLLHNIFNKDISGHTGRGYTLLQSNQKNETESLGQKVDYYPGIKRPLWFVYSGMGSQWISMGADLMKIPIFAEAIKTCHAVLEPKGINLIHVLTSEDKTVFNNSIHAFVGIGAVQIGLTDILKAMGVEPDNIIGHSLGEIACGYQDGSLSKEELILVTYNRGMACASAKISRGAMAAVGLGYKDIVNKCPPEIDIACHNSSTSVTLSGPEEELNKFVRQLTEQGVFAKEVKSGNVAYHSRYIAQCGPDLLKRLRQVIPNPKPRSKRWLSTSVPQDKWDDPLANLSSAEYYTNNLLQPVLFEEASEMIPDNAIVVEIAPHGLLQAILTRSHKDCTHIPLTKRGCSDGVKFLLDAIGALYINGVNPIVDILYPAIEYPVATETPMLSQLVEWEHSEDWPLYNPQVDEKLIAQARDVDISVFDDDYNYLEGNVINGETIMPEAALIVLVWETLSMYKGVDYRYQSVTFKDIKFHKTVHISREKPSKLNIVISKGANLFEVTQDEQLVVNGVVNGITNSNIHDNTNKVRDEIILTTDDIYKIFESRGYNYRDQFKSVQSSNVALNKFHIRWTSNWVTFLDSLIQINNLGRKWRGISVPKFINKLTINVTAHEKSENSLVDAVKCYNAEYNEVCDIVRCAGVEIKNITFEDIAVIEHVPDIIEDKMFWPYYNTEAVDVKTALKIYFQIITENIATNELRVIPFLTAEGRKIYDVVQEFCINNALIDNETKINIEKEINTGILNENKPHVTNVVIFENLFGDDKKIYNLQDTLAKGEFVVAVERSVPKLDSIIRDYFTIISSMSDGNQILVLLKKAESNCDLVHFSITSDTNFDWITDVYGDLKKTKPVVLISERRPFCGLIGFVNKLRKNGYKKVSLLVIDDFHSPKFSPDNKVYKEQLRKNLAINVYKKGQWGGYYYVNKEKKKNTSNVTLTSFTPGVLDSLKWVEAPPISSDNNFVQVYYAGLTSRDLQKVTGDINNDENKFGMDFSGIDKNGDRVMGVIANGAVSKTIVCDPDLLWPVPKHWTMEESASVPLPYLQAYYCLSVRGKLKWNQSVLITDGLGAVGQALIALCLALNCTVYATVSNLNDKNILLTLFPQLSDNNIGLPDDLFFCIVRNTSKGGCDFVINNYNGSLRQAVMKLVGFSGYFMDFNLYDMKNNHNIGMYYLNGVKSYNAVDLSSIFRPENAKDKKYLQRLISEGIRKGIVRPLTQITYSSKDINKAFMLLSLNKNKGGVVVRMRDIDSNKDDFDVMPRLNYSSSGVHIVVCDERGVGIELADRIVKRGVKKLVLIMKQSLVTGYLQLKFDCWMKNDVKIKLWTKNISNYKECNKMLVEVSKMGPIAGIFIVQEMKQVAVKEETPQQFSEQLNDFGMVVNNLDMSTRNQGISYFVVILNKSQSDSQTYTSSLIESMSQRRSEIGLPALVIHNTDQGTSISNLEDSMCSKELMTLFNAIEFGIEQKYTNIRALNLRRDDHDVFIDKVLKILGLPKATELNCLLETTELANFKLNELVLEQLKVLIKDTYKTDYTIEKLQHMDIKSLKKIGESIYETKTAITHGLSAFYNVIDSEFYHVELSQTIIPMITLLNNGADVIVDPQDTYLMMIPGFEDRHEMYNSIAERLKINALSINFGPDSWDKSSIKEMAYHVLQSMRCKIIIQPKFYILGYSFGVNIALEVANILEKEGHVGVVYCLDSSPKVLISQFRAYVGDINGAELENTVIEHIFSIITGHKSNELSEELKTLDTFTKKVEAYTRSLKEVKYSNEYKRRVLESAYRKIKVALDYRPDMKLASELVLIKGTAHPNAVGTSEDYGLSELTTTPVKVFQIDSDHVMAPYDPKVSSIINKMLDQSLQEEFKKKNLCNVYYMHKWN